MYNVTEKLPTDPLEGKFLLRPVQTVQNAAMMYPAFVVARVPQTAVYLCDIFSMRITGLDPDAVDPESEDYVVVEEVVYQCVDMSSELLSIANDMGSCKFFDSAAELALFVRRFGWNN